MDDNLFENLYEKSRAFFSFEKLLNNFVKELINSVSELTCRHFFARNPFSSLPEHLQLNLASIKKVMQSQEYFKIFGYMIVKEIGKIIKNYADSDTPYDPDVHFRKKEYPAYDSKRIKAELKKCLAKFGPKTEQEKKVLSRIIAREIAQKEHVQEYEKVLHKALKKLALKYFPEITEISGNGLRQIDYMLQEYTQKINEHCAVTRRELWQLIS